ncbi:MAG: hypothetical protein KKG92_14525, partial [Gammaproteobacteria bacterium]|nr:hypothetical protein [Gammaproteobacteria bacterium]
SSGLFLGLHNILGMHVTAGTIRPYQTWLVTTLEDAAIRDRNCWRAPKVDHLEGWVRVEF